MKKIDSKFYLLTILIFISSFAFTQTSGIGEFYSSENKVTIYYAAIEGLASIQFSPNDIDKENGIIQAERVSSTNQSEIIKLFVSIRDKEEKVLMKVTLTRPQRAKDDLKEILEKYSNSIKEIITDLEINIDIPNDNIVENNTIKNETIEDEIIEKTNSNQKKSLADRTKNIGNKAKDGISKVKEKVVKKTDNEAKVKTDEVIKIVQKKSEVPEPEFSARVYYLNNNKLNNLERVNSSVDIKVKALGYGGGEVFLNSFNSESNIRFDANNIPRFIIRIEGNIDPEDIINIVSQSSNKKRDRRRFKVSSQTMLGKSRNISDNEVSYSIKRVRDNIYEIVFENGLTAGEYAILPVSDKETSLSGSTTIKITCFGIN